MNQGEFYDVLTRLTDVGLQMIEKPNLKFSQIQPNSTEKKWFCAFGQERALACTWMRISLGH